jgi:hypothetical protein
VDHDHGIALAFVDVAVLEAVAVYVSGLEGEIINGHFVSIP